MADEMKQWVRDDGRWNAIKGLVSKTLLPGIYELCTPYNDPPHLRELNAVQTDRLLSIPGSISEYLSELAVHFWKTAPLYHKMGLLHKRGVLVEGGPGGGKTAACLLVARNLVERGGIAILISPEANVGALSGVLRLIRDVQADTPLMTIFEDIDKHNDRQNKVPNTLLSMLDGEDQVPGIFHIATTNFVEKLDARILNRPSRFDEIIRVGPPSAGTREAYLRNLIPSDTNPDVRQEIISKSEGLMFAHLKELAICVLIYGHSVDAVVSRLQRIPDPAGAGFSSPVPEKAPVRFVVYESVPPLSRPSRVGEDERD